ncbi:MAG: septum formation protein Maf [Tissierellia bacterium]|nr:septum formation protein Maf [Tissierellia bacterium]
MKEFVLATSSPRRKEIFERFNIPYIAVESKVEERLNELDSPIQYTMGLAFEKAYYVSRSYEDSIVIGADTIVVFEDQILEKPRDEDDAFRMLSILSGKVHEVISGISIINLSTNKKVVDYDITQVKFRKLTEDLIHKYIESKEPLDKSGSYGIQGFGGLFVESIFGSYYNVIGLPIVKLDELLIKHFNISLIGR